MDISNIQTKLKFKPDLCGECGTCVAVCSFEALQLSGRILLIFQNRCTMCGNCVEACPIGALELDHEK